MSNNKFECDCTIIHEENVKLVQSKMLMNESFDKVVKFFKTIGDSTRMKILWALNTHEMCVCDLGYVLNMSKSAISHQLKILREENLVTYRREGKNVFYRLSDDHVKQMIETGIEHVFE